MAKQRTTQAAGPRVAEIPFGCDPNIKHTLLSGAEQSVAFYREGWKTVPISPALAHEMAEAEMAAYGLEFLLKLVMGDTESSEIENDGVAVEKFSYRERKQVLFAARALIHTVTNAIGETRTRYAEGMES